MTISKAVDLYLGERAREGVRPRTYDTHRRILDALADAYPHNDVDEITPAMVRRFLDGYRFNRKRGGLVPNSPKTMAQATSTVSCFFRWLFLEGEIKSNPAERISRPKLPREERDDSVRTISSEEALRLLEEADRGGRWNERLAVAVALYLGPRRNAISTLRLCDYDQVERTLLFVEKGGKTIEKPCPDSLADMIDAAIAAGVYETPSSYLVPSKAAQRRDGDRDNRIIWKLIGEVADRAHVDTDTHTLRRAFATFYLEQNPERLVALQNLLGHEQLATTQRYLRALNRRQEMETVRGLDWANAGKQLMESSGYTEKEGFEPSIEANPHEHRGGFHK